MNRCKFDAAQLLNKSMKGAGPIVGRQARAYKGANASTDASEDCNSKCSCKQAILYMCYDSPLLCSAHTSDIA